jgi:iron complex outermembrane receptor protein
MATSDARSCHRPPHIILSGLTLLAMLPFPGLAADDVLELERFEVTGSRIKRVDVEGISPVVVLDREKIERTGATTVTELFRYIIYNSAGIINETLVQGTAPASASIDLRGLGANRTLVLVNGRRLPVFPFAQGGSSSQSDGASFVDINLIPLGAIERVEILKDGASAIYGSDAIAGVVNFILRKDYEGVEISFDLGSTDEGDGGEGHLTFTAGMADERANLTLTFDHMQRNPVWARDRSFSESANGPIDNRSRSGNPGTIVNLNTGSLSPDPRCPPGSVSGPFCLYDFAPWVTLIPEVKRTSVAANGSFEINEGLSAFASAMFMSSDSERDIAPVGIPPELFVGADNPNNIYPGSDLLVAYRFLELGPRRDRFETDTYNIVGGLNGTFNDWDWELGAGTGQVDTSIIGVNGYATLDSMQAEVDNGTLNPFGDSPDFDPESVMYTTRRRGKSTLDFADLKATGDILEMTHGYLSAAVGAEYRKEEYSDETDPLTASGAVMGIGGVSGEGDRTVFAAYAEFAVPLYTGLELQLAGRYDDYDDFGDTVNPKLGLRWQPRSNLLFRASAGTGFKAPSLPELYSGDIRLFDSVFDPVTGAPAEVNVISGGSPDLDAEESNNYNLGMVWDINNAWDLSLDYWRIDNDDAVSTPSAQFFVNNESAYPDNVIRDENGDIDTVIANFQNVASQKVWGIDFSTGARWTTAGNGDFGLNLATSYLGSFEQEPVSGAGFDELAGKDGRPRWRGLASLTWAKANYSASVILNYVGDYELTQNDDTVDAWTPVDVQFGWQPQSIVGGTVTLGVKNLFDEEPSTDPFYVGDPLWPFFNKALNDPRGRFLYARYKHEF